MEYKTELFLSAKLLVGYEQVKGEEAERLLKKQGYEYIHVDNDGNVHALSKNNKIIESGFLKKTKVMETDYELSYFTKADKRTLNELPLHSDKAKVLSKHPSGSYTIVENGKTKTLVINNPTKFWELSNFLIIQIN